MGTIVYINGKFFSEDTARISVFDRGFLFGDSIFEVVRTYNKNKIFALDLHLDRLYESARYIFLKIKGRRFIEQIIRKTIGKGNNQESYVRLVITRGIGREIGMNPRYAIAPNYIVIVKKFIPPPENIEDRCIEAAIASIRRNYKESLNPLIKSGNYLNNVLAHIDAMSKGGVEAIMVNPDGYVAEGTTFNVFMVKKGVYYTPPLSAGILDGITRKVIIKILKENNIKYKEKNIRPEELLAADEVFFTSTLREIQPVIRIDGKRIGKGRVGEYTKGLFELFRINIPRFLS